MREWKVRVERLVVQTTVIHTISDDPYQAAVKARNAAETQDDVYDWQTEHTDYTTGLVSQVGEAWGPGELHDVD